MAQTRIPDPGLTLTSPLVRQSNLALFPIGVYSGFDVAVSGPEELQVAPGAVLMQDGVIYEEDDVATLDFTTPAIPTTFTVVAIHDETGLLGGSAVTLEIRTGKLTTVAGGIPIAFVKHPGVVPLAQSMVTGVGKVKLPDVIADFDALQRVDLVPPFPGTINVAIQGQATIPGTTPSGNMIYTALVPGPSLVQVAHVVAGLNTVLNVVVVGNNVTVNLGTNASGVAISTANQVLSALLASAPAEALLIPDANGSGLGIAGAAPLTPLAGGVVASGLNTSAAAVYDRTTGMTALRISVLLAAPGAENFTLVSVLKAGLRPPRKLLAKTQNPPGSSIAFVLRGTDNIAVTLSPPGFGATGGWVTSEILIGPGVFAPGGFYVLQTVVTVPPGGSLLLGRLSVDADPFALI